MIRVQELKRNFRWLLRRQSKWLREVRNTKVVNHYNGDKSSTERMVLANYLDNDLVVNKGRFGPVISFSFLNKNQGLYITGISRYTR